VIALITTQNLLISEVDEVPAAVPGEPDCKLVNPFVINTETGQTILEPWLLDITRDDIFMLSSDKILTLCDPTPTLLEKYQDITK
jgi:hypothetical protein